MLLKKSFYSLAVEIISVQNNFYWTNWKRSPCCCLRGNYLFIIIASVTEIELRKLLDKVGIGKKWTSRLLNYYDKNAIKSESIRFRWMLVDNVEMRVSGWTLEGRMTLENNRIIELQEWLDFPLKGLGWAGVVGGKF